MHVSEARLAANRANSLRSRGPSSPEGRAISARNSLKHGLTGRGIVTPEGDAEEIARRAEALAVDMKPRTEAGIMLISQMALLSVRMERAVEHESASVAKNVRHAADDFDEARIEKANELFEGLADDPRNGLRKLKKMPEGVDRLIEAWHDLRADLAIQPAPIWNAEQLERAANLAGVKSRHARGTRLGALSRAYWGDFAAPGDGEGSDLDEGSRREWARSMLFERIDAEIASLEAHRETLDFETIAIDRAEAGSRARFDASKPACLARRYESEASRGFFNALKEFRKVEAEAAAPTQPVASPPPPVRPEPEMGSSREMVAMLEAELVRALPDRRSGVDPVVRRSVNDPSRRTRRPKLPR